MPKQKKKLTKDQQTRRKLHAFAQQISKAWQRRAEYLLEMGNILNEARPLKKLEGFKQWVKDKLPFSYSSARNYMNIAKTFQSPDDVMPFSVRSLVLMSKHKFPKELRSEIVESGKKGKEWTVEGIQQEWDAIKEEDQEETSSEKAKESSKSPSCHSEADSAPSQNKNKGERTKAVLKQLIEAAQSVAEVVGGRKKITPKAKIGYSKRIKKVQALLETVLEEIKQK